MIFLLIFSSCSLIFFILLCLYAHCELTFRLPRAILVTDIFVVNASQLKDEEKLNNFDYYFFSMLNSALYFCTPVLKCFSLEYSGQTCICLLLLITPISSQVPFLRSSLYALPKKTPKLFIWKNKPESAEPAIKLFIKNWQLVVILNAL